MVPAKYTPNDVFEDNPFIEALPPMLDERALIRTLAQYPAHNAEVMGKGRMARTQMLNRQLQELYQPLPFVVDMYVQIYCAIQAAYAKDGFVMAPRWPDRAGISFSVVGVSGIGKSVAIKRILSLFPAAIRHTEYHGQRILVTQIPYIHVQTPHDASVRGLCIEILAEIDRVIGVDTEDTMKKARDTTDILIVRVVKKAQACHLGLLVLDEIQNIRDRGQRFMDFIVQFVNSTDVSVCFVGTPQAISPLQETMRAARRTPCIEIDRLAYDAEFQLILDAAWRIQYTDAISPLTDPIRKTLFDKSAGITDILIRLLYYGQMEAILHGQRTVSPALFEAVARKRLRITQGALERGKDALSGGVDSDVGFVRKQEKQG